MTIKSFFIILVLSVVVNEIVMFIDAFFRSSLVAGQAGLPLRFTSSSFFGNANTNYIALFLDVIFWFFIIWIIWKGLQKVLLK